MLDRPDVDLIDVRDQYEWAAGRIAAARHLPLGELALHSHEFDRGRTIVFYCRTGARSAMAAEALDTAGYRAHNMAGGLTDWVAAGLPLEPADGHVA